MTGKVCPKCKLNKPFDDFYRSLKRKDGYAGYCKKCSHDNVDKWCKNNPEKDYRFKRHNALKSKYGVSLLEYEKMCLEQGGACGICFKIPKHALAVDHNHLTGEIRGLLCRNCNTGIGLLMDSIENLASAQAYLLKEKRK